MEELLKATAKIKSLEIQGATNIALRAIEFLAEYAKNITDCNTFEDYLMKLKEAKEVLVKARDTEPALRNGLNYIIKKLEKSKESTELADIPDLIGHYKNKFKSLMEKAKQKIAEIGARRFPDVENENMYTIMTHCHSSVVTGILIEAKRQGKKFTVINTQTQPRLQGRKTANELLEAGIKVIHVVDSAMRYIVKFFKVDVIIIGADSITSEGTVLNKIGSRLLALVAREASVPFYVASPLLKYSPQTSFGILEKIEMRDPKEVWENPPKGIEILNPAFETVSRRYIDGLITEAGIFPSGQVNNYFVQLYPELVE